MLFTVRLTILLPLVLTANAAPTSFDDILPRTTTCGGDSALAPCGGAFPSDFCCPYSSICLPLNVTGAVATVCCPPGVNCRTIQPTTCEQGAYNATTAAANQVHASPITALATCGSACCPAGYTCQNGQTCIAQSATTNSTASAIPTQSLTASTSTALAVSDSSPSAEAQSSGSSFSGGSFAAGFVPGIILGMLLLALIGWLIMGRRKNAEYSEEKARSRDQLTILGPMDVPQQSALHMRSISEPTMASYGGHRTDFLRSSPPDNSHNDSFDTIDEETEAPPRTNPYQPKPMFQFSPNPAPPRSPLPAHLKRGTLSYAISPIRQLRTKKSIHSLRRHAASPIRSNSSRTRSSVARSITSASTETIQVLMTPDQRPSCHASHERSRSPVASSIYQTSQPWTTPSRQPTHPQAGLLGSPYSYQPRDYGSSNYLNVEQPSRSRRVTTFSSLMERAGLKKEDLLAGDS